MNRQIYPPTPTPQPTDTGMSVDDAAFAMNLIHRFCEETFDHSWASLLPVIGLLKTLLETPEKFWDEWFSVTDTPHNKELRAKVNEFINSPGFDPRSIEQLRQFTETV
jgi:hypothetical protein